MGDENVAHAPPLILIQESVEAFYRIRSARPSSCQSACLPNIGSVWAAYSQGCYWQHWALAAVLLPQQHTHIQSRHSQMLSYANATAVLYVEQMRENPTRAAGTPMHNWAAERTYRLQPTAWSLRALERSHADAGPPSLIPLSQIMEKEKKQLIPSLMEPCMPLLHPKLTKQYCENINSWTTWMSWSAGKLHIELHWITHQWDMCLLCMITPMGILMSDDATAVISAFLINTKNYGAIRKHWSAFWHQVVTTVSLFTGLSPGSLLLLSYT